MSDQPEQDQDALAFLRAGQSESQFIATLIAALTVSRLHALDNVAVKDAVASLAESLTSFLRIRERAVILVAQSRIYINGRLLRTGHAGRGRMDDFQSFMDRMHLGGLVFTGSWTEPTVRQMLALVQKVDKEVPKAQRARTLRLGLEKLPQASEMAVLDPAQAEVFVQEEEEGYVSAKERAAYYYARLVTLCEASHRSIGEGLGPDIHTRHLRQTITRLVDQLHDPVFELRLVGLTAILPEADSQLGFHSANVAIYSVLMGHLLGLGRAALSDLTFAALSHDLGRAVHPRTAETETTAEGEMHIIRGMRNCLRARNYGTSGLFRIIVSQEHHRLADGYPNSPALREPHLFSQIVGVADAFDHLQNGFAGEGGMQPKDALDKLLSEPGRYTPEVVDLLRDMLGRYPRGTTFRLWDGGIGVVISGGARRGNRPIVRRLLLADQTPDEERTILELPDPEQHAKVVDPADFYIDWRTAAIE